MMKDIGVLSIGSGVSQLAAFFSYMLLARLYSPESFGLYAVLIGLAAIIGSVSSCRYEMTVLLPRTDRWTNVSKANALLISLFMNFSLTLVYVFLALLGIDFFRDNWWVLSILSVGMSVSNISGFVCNREKKYIFLILSQLSRTIIFAVFAYLFMLFGGEGRGLEFSMCLSLALVSSAQLVLLFDWNEMLKIKPKYFIVWARRHIKFLKYSAPAVLVGSVAGQLPLLLFYNFFGEASAGVYSLVHRVIMAPVGIVSGAVNRVYIQVVAKSRVGNKKLWSITRRIIIYGVCLAGGAVFVFSIMFKLEVLSLLFGPSWHSIDSYAMALLPWFAMSFIAKSVSGFAVLGRNELGLYFQVLQLLVVAASVFIAYMLALSFHVSLVLMASAMSIVCLIQVVSVAKITKKMEGV